MRYNFRRLRPGALFDSFLGVLDIKLGAEIVLLFGLINKVAGVYGAITILIGGSLPQLAFYAYSVATLFAFLWALKVVKSESAQSTLLISHLYILDHFIQFLFHTSFYHHYWFVTKHNGERIIHSSAQQDLIDLAVRKGQIVDPSTEHGEGVNELRAALAGEIWRKERVYAVWFFIAAFVLKLYLSGVLYSYAAHLRSSTYHALPLTSRSRATQIAHPTTVEDIQAEMDHDELIEGASNGDAGKGGVLVGTQGRTAKGKGKGKDLGLGEAEEDFSWD